MSELKNHPCSSEHTLRVEAKTRLELSMSEEPMDSKWLPVAVTEANKIEYAKAAQAHINRLEKEIQKLEVDFSNVSEVAKFLQREKDSLEADLAKLVGRLQEQGNTNKQIQKLKGSLEADKKAFELVFEEKKRDAAELATAKQERDAFKKQLGYVDEDRDKLEGQIEKYRKWLFGFRHAGTVELSDAQENFVKVCGKSEAEQK